MQRIALRSRGLFAVVAGLLLGLSSQPAAANWWWVLGDEAAPQVEQLEPESGSALRERSPTVIFRLKDPYNFGFRTSRLDPSTLRLLVDGEDRTDEAVFQGGGLSRLLPWWPPLWGYVGFEPSSPLPEGEITFTVIIADRAGNVGRGNSTLILDSTPPTATALQPDGDSPVPDPATALVIGITDVGVGIDWDSLQVSASGGSFTSNIDAETGQLTITPESEWPEGALAIEIDVADTLGNASSTRLSYRINPRVELAVTPVATPVSGEAPLAVTFTPQVITTGAIERYEWDLNGDGSFDRSETVGREQTYTYRDSGVYTVTLRVTDNRNEQATGTATVTVGNAPPVVRAEARPSNGAPPLQVYFSATASDRDGIAGYEWDFEGDGAFDRATDTGDTTYTYTEAGVYQPRVRVTDNAGAATEIAVPTLRIQVEDGVPSVTASASPTSGDPPLSVSLSASATDPDGLEITQWAWDFGGDGAEDYVSATSASTTHEFTAAGTYFPEVRATASDGDSSTDVVRISVRPTFELSLGTDSIDAALGESAEIETRLGADTRVSLVMEGPGGRVVKTLVPWQTRLAGTYTDAWDGTDDTGQTVSTGAYRAVLLYEVDGVEKRFDLAGTTGGREYNPTRSRLPSTFAPFANDPLEITFSLPEASEVTAFMGRFNVNARLVTFLQREPLGRGSHTIVWNGENADGELIQPPPGDRFLFGIFAFSLPDNAVYVRSGVHASGVRASPPVFDPTRIAANGEPARSSVTFDLSGAGDVGLAVYDTEAGALVSRERITGLDAGENTVSWDGRTRDGEYVAPGAYRLGVTGLDPNGARTTTVFTLQRVYY